MMTILPLTGSGLPSASQRHDPPCDLLAGRIVRGRADIASARIEASLFSMPGLPRTEIHERWQHPIFLSGAIAGGTGLPGT